MLPLEDKNMSFKKQDFENFLKAIQYATKRIDGYYFKVPFSSNGKVNHTYLERVYCYELYFYIRKYMIKNRKRFMHEYVLYGEVDKAGHPIGKKCGKKKPDLIVHSPGDDERNLAVVEVKFINNNNKKRACKDLDTLRCFLEDANYFGTIYLVYGETERDSEKKFAKFEHLTHEELGGFRDKSVSLIWHRKPTKRADCLNIA
jgi:hypothetical protein